MWLRTNNSWKHALRASVEEGRAINFQSDKNLNVINAAYNISVYFNWRWDFYVGIAHCCQMPLPNVIRVMLHNSVRAQWGASLTSFNPPDGELSNALIAMFHARSNGGGPCVCLH